MGLPIQAMDKVVELSKCCKFKNCTHTNEIGCSVLEAVNNREIEQPCYENYLKMVRENAYFELTSVEKRRKNKDFGKMLNNYKKGLKKSSKYK